MMIRIALHRARRGLGGALRLGLGMTLLLTGACGGGGYGGASMGGMGPTTAPVIAMEPMSVSVKAGSTATFSVMASGYAPLSYQWMRDGASIAGATGSSYTTPATTPADSGASYAVQVSNAYGSKTSSPALLSVT